MLIYTGLFLLLTKLGVYFHKIFFSCLILEKKIDNGSFQLVDLIKDHMTCYKFECSHWWKIYL